MENFGKIIGSEEKKVTEKKFQPLKEMTYEQALAELEELVAALEMGDNDLETTLRYFERGQSLASYCLSLLENAELTMEQILEDDDLDSA